MDSPTGADEAVSADGPAVARAGAAGDLTVGERALHRLHEFRRELWIVAVLFFGVGDTVTTMFGVHSGRAVEASPVVASLLDGYGVTVVVPVKLFTFALFALGWRLLPSPHRLGFPLGLSVVGVVATGWNLVVLALTF